MSNDPDPVNSSGVSTEELSDWLDQMARDRDKSREEVLNEMVSSYWILNELADFAQGTSPDHAKTTTFDSSGSTDDDSPDDSPGQEADADDSPDQEADADDPAEGSEPTEESEAEPSTPSREAVDLDAFDSDLEFIVRAIESISDIRKRVEQIEARDASNTGSRDGAERPAAVPPRGRRRRPERARWQQTDALFDLEDRIDDLDEELDEIRSDQSSQIDRVADEVQLLSGRLENIDARLEETPDAAVLDELMAQTDEKLEGLHQRTAELKEELEETRQTHDEFESDVNAEFDGIESVFERLFDDLDDVETQLDEQRSSYRSDMHAIQQQYRQRSRLAKLKRRAAHIGTTTATCENCSETVNIGLLEVPQCPHCEQACTDISEGSRWNPFSSPVLHTEPQAASPLDGSGREFPEELGPSDDET